MCCLCFGWKWQKLSSYLLNFNLFQGHSLLGHFTFFDTVKNEYLGFSSYVVLLFNLWWMKGSLLMLLVCSSVVDTIIFIVHSLILFFEFFIIKKSYYSIFANQLSSPIWFKKHYHYLKVNPASDLDQDDVRFLAVTDVVVQLKLDYS
jgi:hypothetical protein